MEWLDKFWITLTKQRAKKFFNINNILIALAVLSLIGIFFFPRLKFPAEAKIRLEDITSIFVFAVLSLAVARKKLTLYQETLFPLVYFFYGFAISFIRALAKVDVFGYYFIIFWGKEFQYYIFFLLFYYLFLKGRVKTILLSLVALAVTNTAIGAYKILNGVRDCYGIGAKFVEDAPSLSGQIYFGCMLAALFTVYLGFIKNIVVRVILYLIIVASFLSCLATGSKSSSFGIIMFGIVFLALRDLSLIQSLDKLLLKYCKWMILTLVAIGMIYLYYNVLNYQVLGINLGRLRNPIESTIQRYSTDIKSKFNRINGIDEYITGTGYLAGQNDENRVWYTSAYDSQYGRNILVIGIIGTFIWCIMLFNFGWFIRKNTKKFIFYISLLVSYLFMGIGVESFGASKSGPIFWIIVGMLLGMDRRQRLMSAQNEQRSYEK